MVAESTRYDINKRKLVQDEKKKRNPKWYKMPETPMSLLVCRVVLTDKRLNIVHSRLQSPSYPSSLLGLGHVFGRQTCVVDAIKLYELIHVELRLLRLDKARGVSMHWQIDGMLRIHLVEAVTVL